jgi:hypothetical protein
VNGVSDRPVLFAEKVPCSFKACSITYGFEDNFFSLDGDPERLGWHPALEKSGKWQVLRGGMHQIDANALNSVLAKVHDAAGIVYQARLCKDAGSHFRTDGSCRADTCRPSPTWSPGKRRI